MAYSSQMNGVIDDDAEEHDQAMVSKKNANESQFVDVAGTEEVDTLFSRSHEEPVLVFKHDPWCIVSAMAHRQLKQLGGDIPTINVAGSEALSLGLADRTGIRHESPQVMVLSGGEVAWTASHGAITREAVEDALTAARQATRSTADGS
jgi:bacillithiol system protein YtxJ